MTETSNHPNSKIIFIRRTSTFLDAVQKDAIEFMSMSRKAIGPYWQSTSSKAVGSGLDFNEISLLLPQVIDRESSDRDFREKVKEFYCSILTFVPYGPEGIKLEVGLLLDNSKPITYSKDGLYNMPINVMDYIRYRHALTHPQVATNPQSAVGDQTKMYFVFDPVSERTQKVESTKLEDEAMTTYLSIKASPSKVSDMLLVMGIDPRELEDDNARTVRLRTEAVKNPIKFMDVYKTDNFELRAKIRGLVNTRILNEVGERVYETSTNTLIAKNMAEAVKVLQDPAYSEKLSIWMGSYQDIVSKSNKGNKPKPKPKPEESKADQSKIEEKATDPVQ